MREVVRSDLLEIVGCDIAARPDAPSIGELAPHVVTSERSGGVLRVTFPGAAKEDVEAFAAAERVCCGGIDWAVEGGRDVVLSVRASEPALDVIEGALRRQLNIEKDQ